MSKASFRSRIQDIRSRLWSTIRNEPERDRRRFWFITYVILFSFGMIGIVLSTHYVYRYNLIINQHLRSHRWALPSTIYADSPVITVGSPVSMNWLIRYLMRLNYIETRAPFPKPGQYKFQNDAIIFRRSFDISEKEATDYPVRVQFGKSGISSLINETGKTELPSYELEPAPISDLFGSKWEKRLLVQLQDVPMYLPKAVIAIEDRRFYEHNGIDPIAIGRAMWNDLRGNRQMQGASTITQQLVKNLYLTPKRTLKRKLSEVVMAMMMERKLTKDEILELYLNEIYLGQRGSMSINGVGAASQLFFHKKVRYINVAEAALLAGMIQAPAVYNPYKHAAEARLRRNTVLLAMRNGGAITQEQYQKFCTYPIEVYPIDVSVNLAPYFGDLVERQLMARYDQETIYQRNYRVFTTIDLSMQQMAEDALKKGLEDIDKIRYKTVKKEAQGCLIAIEPSTGYVRAFVGGRSYSKSQFDRVYQASRQPGSLFKPIVYAAALESAFNSSGRPLTAATLVSDEPAIFKFEKVVWEPRNYDSQYHGIVTFRDALAQSMNVATAKVAQQIGLGNVVALAKQMGINTVRGYPSVALGTFEASPWQLIEAYSVFANQGLKSDLLTVKKVTDNEGKVVEIGRRASQQVLHPEVAYIITDMLKSVLTWGTAASSRRLGFTRVAAGKTGTTDEYRDAWFAGYTPDLLCLVWTGYDDNTPLKMNGAQAALPIWVRFMKMAAARYPERDFTPARGVVAADIDAQTGKLAGPYCYDIRTEVFIPGTEPQPCTEYDHEMLYEGGGSDLQIVGGSGTPLSGTYPEAIPTTPPPEIVGIPGSDENSNLTDSESVEPVQEESEPRPDQPIYFAPPPRNSATPVQSNSDVTGESDSQEQANEINSASDQNPETQNTQTQDSGRERSNEEQHQTSETDQDEPQSQPP